ncbi:hypothetical protein ASG49_05790 [Marmoricola sp. Leaf446]|uniref:type IV toxin-antitoxin system AbiEi family antitoxin domain-containing protein n=1 Tax=Marmoricola sp. Leaf446 TaxID=1736379 RepID=UPI0006F40BFB|nr:type IV toxin-antitoxin system AbiEi family antitoxin domain-containing protein [Marmoricola sp. Leaf446]KQT94391.1 hypothetical protein ASG49_05790 [Marmoricola sp. Leaf446]
MDDPLRVIALTDGVFLRREALECGYDDKTIARRVRGGEWHRVRHGAYCFGDTWRTSTPDERHLLLARAVLRTTPGPVALSHTTALLAHGVAVWGADLSRVHVTRLDTGAARREKDVVHHVAACSDDDVETVGDVPVLGVARSVVETATVTGLESALVSADSALHLEKTERDELRRTFAGMTHRPGAQKIHVVLHHMDGRSESPGETRAAYLFWRHGLPRPARQHAVRDASGRVVARVDFAWHEHGVFGEFDGRVKYGRYLRPWELPGDAVFREKQREDLVRELTGYRFVRLVWADLEHPEQTAARVRAVLARLAA